MPCRAPITTMLAASPLPTAIRKSIMVRCQDQSGQWQYLQGECGQSAECGLRVALSTDFGSEVSPMGAQFPYPANTREPQLAFLEILQSSRTDIGGCVRQPRKTVTVRGLGGPRPGRPSNPHRSARGSSAFCNNTVWKREKPPFEGRPRFRTLKPRVVG